LLVLKVPGSSLGIQELDRRAALAAKRRVERAARVAVIEAEVMMQRVARD
jgi:hypothetical protein